jgi:tetratricopeptide (TPR) repeat protein
MARSPGAQSASDSAIPPNASTSNLTPPNPTTPLPIPADSRAFELKNQADSLAALGNLSAAMALYDEALRIAPRSAEIYRGRALALSRLGDRVQAQSDYRRFLELDPQGQNRVEQEFQLFQQSAISGYPYSGCPYPGSVNSTNSNGDNGGTSTNTRPYPGSISSSGETAPGPTGSSNNGFAYYDPLTTSYALNYTPYNRQILPTFLTNEMSISHRAAAADRNYEFARRSFANGDYDTANAWVQHSNSYLPQARTNALLTEIMFAQGLYRDAAAAARAAAAMGPLIDAAMLYGYYDFDVARYGKQFQLLQDYVRANPSSADARFLLGYEHRVLDQKDLAHAQLGIATTLDPLDVVAKQLLARDGVEVVGADETAIQKMMPREGLNGTIRVGRVPPPPPAPSETPIKR